MCHKILLQELTLDSWLLTYYNRLAYCTMSVYIETTTQFEGPHLALCYSAVGIQSIMHKNRLFFVQYFLTFVLIPHASLSKHKNKCGLRIIGPIKSQWPVKFGPLDPTI